MHSVSFKMKYRSLENFTQEWLEKFAQKWDEIFHFHLTPKTNTKHFEYACFSDKKRDFGTDDNVRNEEINKD